MAETVLGAEAAEKHPEAFQDIVSGVPHDQSIGNTIADSAEDDMPPLAEETSRIPDPLEEDDEIHMLSVGDIINAEDGQTVLVHVEQWGGDVKVRSLTQKEASGIYRRSLFTKGKHKGDFNPARYSMLMFITGCVEPQFEVAHYDALAKKNAGAIATVVNVINDISGMKDAPGILEAAEEDFD